MNKMPIILALLVSGSVFAQDYVKTGPIGGESAVSCPTTDKAVTPISCLVGERILILPQPINLRSYGYQMIRPFPRVGLRGIKYEEGAGKIGVIDQVILDDYSHKVVRAKMETGELFEIHSYSSSGRSFDNIVFLKDIDSARKLYLNNALWLNSATLWTLAQDGKTSPVTSQRFSKVLVTDVVAAESAEKPVRFIVQTENGSTAYIDVRMSDINSTPTSSMQPRFDHAFFTSDPKQSNKWSAKYLALIERSQVSLGMTEDQVLMSWGAPDSINSTRLSRSNSEQWVYGLDRFVYFSDGKVTAIQD